MNLGAPELAIVFLVVLLLFGGAKLPQLARSLGQAQSEFRSAVRDPGAAPGRPGARHGDPEPDPRPDAAA